MPLVDAMRVTQATLRAQDQLPLPSDEVAGCERREYLNYTHDPPVIGEFFEALLSNLPEATAAPLCNELVARFGPGFPEENRDACGGAP